MSRDRTVGDTFFIAFTTRAFATGIPTVLAGTPVVSAYEDAGLTQITAGITLGIDHDGVVGLNMLTIVATGGNGYETVKDYNLVITAGTVGGVSVIGEVVGQFSLSLSAAAKDLANGTDGLGAIKGDTAEIGTAGAGLSNINLPDQTMNITGNITGNLSGSVGSVTGAVGSVTGAVGSVAGNVDGNVTGSVGSVSGDTKQTGDNFPRLGAPVGASISADIAATPAGVLAAGDIDGFSLEETQKLIAASALGILAGAATTTITIQAIDGSKTRITATVDADGNRSVVVKDVTG